MKKLDKWDWILSIGFMLLGALILWVQPQGTFYHIIALISFFILHPLKEALVVNGKERKHLLIGWFVLLFSVAIIVIIVVFRPFHPNYCFLVIALYWIFEIYWKSKLKKKKGTLTQ